MPRFLDTNILLRHLTADDEEKARACRELLLRVEQGVETVATSDLVVAEAVFILQSPRQYGLQREQICRLLEPVVRLRGLRLPNKALYAKAFDLYCQRNISFTDAFNAAYMESRGLNEIYSYDTDFDGVEGVKRVEPQV